MNLAFSIFHVSPRFSVSISRFEHFEQPWDILRGLVVIVMHIHKTLTLKKYISNAFMSIGLILDLLDVFLLCRFLSL